MHQLVWVSEQSLICRWAADSISVMPGVHWQPALHTGVAVNRKPPGNCIPRGLPFPRKSQIPLIYYILYVNHGGTRNMLSRALNNCVSLCGAMGGILEMYISVRVIDLTQLELEPGERKQVK